MSMTSGTQFNSYLIGESIGVGGMGEVYRASDTKLKRDVAIKVLPESLAADAERLARFQREAELLASLNHTNIAQIFGLEKANGITALIMELIDGPTLAERIEQGLIPPDEALNIALQIAAALEAAHGRGIIHRDLKPANIKLRPDGTVKVLDFGIAKALEAPGNSGPVSPVLTTPAMTMSGVILGTAAYMSPEQARGKAVDERADIWAFGCVLYEMLSGQPVFGGEDVTVTLARVLERELDLGALPAMLSPAVRHTIKLCLRKDPKKRIRHISDVRLALEGEFDTGAGSVTRGAATSGTKLPALLAAVAATVLVAVATWWLKPLPLQDLSVKRFAYSIPDNQTLRSTNNRVLAVSPDGQRFVYNTALGLFLRSMGELDARQITGTEETLFTPIFSPDGEYLAYFSNAGLLKRIPIAGGAAVTLAAVAQAPFDASWSADGSIFYSQSTGIYRIPGTGGSPALVIDTGAGQFRMTGAELLPDGDTLLFAIGPVSNEWDRAQIVAQSLSTGARTVLVNGGTDPHYLPSGHLVYGFGDSLLGIAFDADTLTVSGGAVPLAQGLLRADNTATSNYGVGNDGTLVYLSGFTVTQRRNLLWVSRDGTEQAVPIEASGYLYPRISPDGEKVALDIRNQDNEIQVWDFARETRTRMILGEAGSWYPAWSPDGAYLVFQSLDTNSITRKAANNTGAVEVLLDDDRQLAPYFITPDAQHLVFRAIANSRTVDDIAMMKLDGSGFSEVLLGEAYIERNAELSPDGRWLAYQSNESGTWEIYVRPFPDVNADKVQVSNAGGTQPLWSRDGNELFYLEFDTQGDFTMPVRLMSVPVEVNGTRFDFGARTVVMNWPYLASGDGRNYDVAPDGQRFLVLRNIANDGNENSASRVIIVQNWTEELQRVVPVEK